MRPSLKSGRGWGWGGITSALLVAVLLVGGCFTGDLYFRWARDPVLFYETDADLALAARWLIAQPVTGEPIYLAALDKGHPTVMIEPVPPITWLGTDSLFAPPPGQTGLYIFPRRVSIPADWAAWLAPGKLDGLPLGPDGQPAFAAFRISGDAPLPLPPTTISARNPDLTFAGVDAPAIAAGDRGQLTMGWRVSQPPDVSDLTPLLQIEDQQGDLIYRGDAYMAGTDGWRAGETLIQRLNVTIPPATPPGDYTVNIAWVERASNHYLSYLNQQGGQGGIWAQIGSLTVTRPATFPDPVALPIGIRQPTQVATGVTLLGWDAPPTSLRPGESLPLTLYWQASGDQRAAITLTADLSGANGAARLWQGQPIADRYPANQWAAGEVLADRERWTIPRDLAAGNYNIVLKIDEKILNVGSLSVAGTARIFAPPPVEHVVKVNFDNTILLYGYTIKTDSEQFYIEIVWQALNNINSDYKVFVHLVDSGGVILAQRDAMPQANSYPTSWWLHGEYVVDTYQLPVPNVGYSVQVGLYSPQDGTRLPVLDAAGHIHGDYTEVPD